MNATRRQCNGSYALQPFDDFGREFVGLAALVAVPELATATVAKGVDVPVDAQHEAVVCSRRHRSNLHTIQPLDGPRRPLLFFIAVPELAVLTVAERVDNTALA